MKKLTMKDGETKMKSHIYGEGYGSSHQWIRGGTNQVGSDWMNKASYYGCPCGATFSHPYDIIPDIFEAMRIEGVVDICPLSNDSTSKGNGLEK